MDKNYNTTFLSERKRGNHLTFEDRCIIKVLHKQNKSLRDIARALNCSPSTVLNELRRGTKERKSGSGRPPEYNPNLGQKTYEANRSRCNKPYKLEDCAKFISYVISKFKESSWSIDECVGRAKLSLNFQSDEMVSTKTIYNYIWKGLIDIKSTDLPEALKRSISKHKRIRKNKRLIGRSIEERPAYISQCTEIGHWEIDTVVGKRKGKESVILTLLEKTTRKYLAYKISGKNSEAVMAKISEIKDFCGERFKDVFKSITADNGTEFSTLLTAEKYGTVIYYSHPYSSWERPQNERFNRILRKFVPKGASIDTFTSDDILEFSDRINSTPRKVLGYRTSDEMFETFLDEVYALNA